MMTSLRKPLIAAALALAALGGPAAAASNTAAAPHAYEPIVGQDGKDVVWVPTEQALVDRMLDMARLTPQDRLVDLGSGDGITVITAARRGVTARGIEFNDGLVDLARQRAAAAGVSNRASFEHGDIFESNFTDATVVTLFLLPSLNLRLRPTLLDMKPGTRIVANTFDMDDWGPDEVAQVSSEERCEVYCTALLWIVPAKVDGEWRLDGQQLEIEQRFQQFGGQLHAGSTAKTVSGGHLNGASIHFVIGGDHYAGEVDGDTMKGTINGSRPWRATRTPRTAANP